MNQTTRKLFGASLATTLLCIAFGAAATDPPQPTPSLILLGTKGGPALRSADHLPFSNVLQINGVSYVVDAGYGVSLRLVQSHVPLASIRYVFITHHHSDHNLEYGALLYNAWISGLSHTVDSYGPAGMVALDRAWWEANRFDIDTRIADEGRLDIRKLVVAHDYGPGTLLDNGDVKVTALRNHHPPVTDSYALKFEFGGKTVVFSGDTSYFPPLADFARGADYLVHEVMDEQGAERLAERGDGKAQTLLAHLQASHTLAEDAGRIASEAGVKHLVLSHFVPGDDPSIVEQDWIDAVRKHYAGPIIFGRDLLKVSIQ